MNSSRDSDFDFLEEHFEKVETEANAEEQEQEKKSTIEDNDNHQDEKTKDNIEKIELIDFEIESSSSDNNNDDAYDRIDEIIDGLCLSSIGPVADERKLRSHRIVAIISVLDSERTLPSQRFDGIAYDALTPILDDEREDLLNRFVDFNRRIASLHAIATERGGRCLIHCYNGVSRCATILAAYLVSTYPIMTAEAVLELIREKRPIIDPNAGFCTQLTIFASGTDGGSGGGDGSDDTFHFTATLDYIRYQSSLVLNEIVRQSMQIIRSDIDSSSIDIDLFDEPNRCKQIEQLNCAIADYDHRLQSASSSSSSSSSSAGSEYFACKKCRKILFSANATLENALNDYDDDDDDDDYDQYVDVNDEDLVEKIFDMDNRSPLHLLTLPPWMMDCADQRRKYSRPDGRIECPRCRGKIGRFRWTGSHFGARRLRSRNWSSAIEIPLVFAIASNTLDRREVPPKQ